MVNRHYLLLARLCWLSVAVGSLLFGPALLDCLAKPAVFHPTPTVEDPDPDPDPEPAYPPGWDTYVEEATITAKYHGNRWINGPYNDVPPLPHDPWDYVVVYGQYDPGYGYLRLSQFVGGDVDLITYAAAAMHNWRDTFSIANSGSLPGYYNYTDGLRIDWTENANTTSRDALIDQAVSASFAATGNLSGAYDIRQASLNREIAYAAEGYINSEVYAGQTHNARLLQYVLLMMGDVDDDISISTASPTTANLDDGGHIEQWLGTYTTDADGDYVSGTTEFVSNNFAPFMGAITIHALTRYYDEAANINGGITPDARTIPKIVRLLDAIWNETWGTANGATTDDSFYYRPDDKDGDSVLDDVDPNLTNGRTYALNNLIAFGYWWAFLKTGDQRHRIRGDAAFAGSLNLGSLVYRGSATQSYLSKEFQESLRWTIDGFEIRAAGVALHGE